jgi:MFS family permease
MTNFSSAFNRLWSAAISSNFADGILRVSVPLIAVKLTTSPVSISAISALTMLPWLLFAIPIGGLADRINRKKFLAFAHAVRTIVAALVSLAITTHVLTIELLFLAVAIFGTCEVIADTTAQTLIPRLLTKEQREKGNSRLYLAETLVQDFMGSPTGGFLYGVAIGLPLFISSAGYFIAAVLVLAIPLQALHDVREKGEEPKDREPFWSEIRFGIKYLYEHKLMLHLVLMTTSLGFWFNFGTATVVLFILKVLHLKPQYFGLVMAIQGTGSIIASLTAARASERFGRARVMGWSMIVQCAIWIATAFLTNIVPFVLMGIIATGLGTYWNILIMVTYQELIPNHLYGRIHGTRRTLVWGMMPFGSLLGGYVSTFGLRIPIFIGGVIGTVIAALNFRFLQRLIAFSVSVNHEKVEE